MRQYMNEGTLLAITPEPAEGAPGGVATGPVLASGKMIIL
jgi:anti-sigma-K factor RskA